MRLSGAPSIDIEWRYNSERRTAWAIVPGLSGAVVMISMLMLGALCLVREREQGTWEQLLSSPIRTLEALAGKLLPYLAVGLAQTAIVITMAHVLFGLPVRGSALMLMIGSGLTAACYLAIGFAISARVDTSMQAIQVAVFLYLPSMVLSGFMFPFNGMPRWAQLAGELVPLTHFVRIARDTVLRDAPTIRTAPDLVWLGGLAVALIAAAVILYRNRPE